ncbi:MAG: TIGR03790 family protein [Deltaproteobacteria bacterium]|nr:TIGR03790 family protein [Deltaproteobacteria bacterium]
MSALSLLLFACVNRDKPVSDGVADSVGDSVADSATDDSGADCGPGEITAEGEAIPGGVLTLSAARSARWEVSAGALSAEEGLEVTWTLPTDVAVNVAEELLVAATACEIRAERLISVDWPISARVVVLYNPSASGSEDVARAYRTARGLPETALCGVESADTTTLPGDALPDFVSDVFYCVDQVGPQVQLIVPVYGVPYKVADRVVDIADPTRLVTVSLDALLVFGRDATTVTEAVYNPLYRDGDSVTGAYPKAVPFGQQREVRGDGLYLVTRLDGADSAGAMDLIERTVEAEALARAGLLDGVVYVDGRYGDSTPDEAASFGSYEWGEWNMWGTRRVFEALGAWPVVWDGNEAEFGAAPAPLTCPDALFYAGWYSYYNYNDAFTWAPGAVGGHLDSCSACDLRSGTWSAEALKRGITATFGAVNEPYVAGMPEYDQLFYALTQGATFAEAAYQSTVVGGWMMVFVGDPLYQPFDRPTP